MIFQMFLINLTPVFFNSHSTELIDSANVELEKINMWTLANRLTINVDKTELIVFSNQYFDKTSITNGLPTQLAVNFWEFILMNVFAAYTWACLRWGSGSPDPPKVLKSTIRPPRV